MASALSLYDVWFSDGSFTGFSVYASEQTLNDTIAETSEFLGRRVVLRKSGSFPKREGE